MHMILRKGSLTLTFVKFILFSTYFTGSAVDVQWEANFPAVFGNVAYLQCNISDAAFNCTKSPRQWIGGPDYTSLCYEDKCPTSNKYKVMKQPNCLYTLMIRNFSEKDVNCEYTCSYGVSRKRRNFTLDEERFIYKPHVKDIKENVIVEDTTLHWIINITKIFPKPSCGTVLNGENDTADMQISVTKLGFYYATDLQISYNVSSCGKINVYCNLGEYKINITSKNIDSCQVAFKSSKKNTIVVIVAIVSSVVVLGIAILLSCYWCRKRDDNRYDLFSLWWLSEFRWGPSLHPILETCFCVVGMRHVVNCWCYELVSWIIIFDRVFRSCLTH